MATKKVTLKDINLEYLLKRNRKAKNIKLLIDRNSDIIVTAPSWVPKIYINAFVKRQKDWITKHINTTKSNNSFVFEYPYKKYKEKARALIEKRVRELNVSYGFAYNKISIRNQRTRWGSCSSKKNLNFNYRLLFLPTELRDYVIVHELCHLREMNHSKRFWALVGETIPNYKELRKRLKSEFSLGQNLKTI